MTAYFGPRWDAPMLDPEYNPIQLSTPVGAPCMRCREPIADGDRGLVYLFTRSLPGGESEPMIEAIHAECDLLGAVGHRLGVCSCTGFDTTDRETARELLRRVDANRALSGMPPLYAPR